MSPAMPVHNQSQSNQCSCGLTIKRGSVRVSLLVTRERPAIVGVISPCILLPSRQTREADIRCRKPGENMNEGDVGIYANLPNADMSAQDVSGVLKIISKELTPLIPSAISRPRNSILRRQEVQGGWRVQQRSLAHRYKTALQRLVRQCLLE